jgi:hypothetical protein
VATLPADVVQTCHDARSIDVIIAPNFTGKTTVASNLFLSALVWFVKIWSSFNDAIGFIFNFLWIVQINKSTSRFLPDPDLKQLVSDWVSSAATCMQRQRRGS